MRIEGPPQTKPPKGFNRREFIETSFFASAAVVFKTSFFNFLDEVFVKEPKPIGALENEDANTHVENIERLSGQELAAMNREERIKYETEEISSIIENKDMSAALENPYLVSLMYYSQTYLDKVKSGTYKKSGQVEIAQASVDKITPSFREAYLDYLDNLYQERTCDDVNQDHLGAFEMPLEGKMPKPTKTSHPDALDIFAYGKDVEIAAASGGLIILSEDGWSAEDEFSTSSIAGGNTLIIYNPKTKEMHRYAHLTGEIIESGESVKAGDAIAQMGETGKRAAQFGRGNHLHFEVHTYNSKENTMEVVSAKKLYERLGGI